MIAFEINKKIDEIIFELSLPLTETEINSGWTHESKKAIKNYFENLKCSIELRETLPPLDVCRGMDHWGISGGTTFDKAAYVTNRLREDFHDAR